MENKYKNIIIYLSPELSQKILSCEINCFEYKTIPRHVIDGQKWYIHEKFQAKKIVGYFTVTRIIEKCIFFEKVIRFDTPVKNPEKHLCMSFRYISEDIKG